jgi:hypothetical protein
MIDINKIAVGDKVHYDYFKDKEGFESCPENGVVKQIVSGGFVRVVYHCDNNWDRFEDYTSALTCVESLYYGWV